MEILGLKFQNKVREGYISGLEKFEEKGGDLSQVHSVASFFISRVDAIIDNQLNKLIPLRKKHENFQDPNYHLLSKIKTFFNTNRVFVNNTFVLNNITKYLHEHNLLPAICFVFSRRKAEQFAKTISLSFKM